MITKPSCETCGDRGRIRVSKGDSEDCPDCGGGVVTKRKLGDIAREVTAKAKYGGHQSGRDQEHAQHRAQIDRSRSKLEQEVLGAAQRGASQITLMQLGSGCVGGEERNGGDYYANKKLKCDQCIAFKQELEREGFVVTLGEDKHFFLFNISWKEA